VLVFMLVDMATLLINALILLTTSRFLVGSCIVLG